MTALELEFLLNDHGLTLKETSPDSGAGVVSLRQHPQVKAWAVFGGYQAMSKADMEPMVETVKRRLAT